MVCYGLSFGAAIVLFSVFSLTSWSRYLHKEGKCASRYLRNMWNWMFGNFTLWIMYLISEAFAGWFCWAGLTFFDKNIEPLSEKCKNNNHIVHFYFGLFLLFVCLFVWSFSAELLRGDFCVSVFDFHISYIHFAMSNSSSFQKKSLCIRQNTHQESLKIKSWYQRHCVLPDITQENLVPLFSGKWVELVKLMNST